MYPLPELGAADVIFVPNCSEHTEPRRDLDNAQAAGEAEVGVKPPSKPGVERLRAINIRDGDNHHFDLQICVCDGRKGCVITAHFVCEAGISCTLV